MKSIKSLSVGVIAVSILMLFACPGCPNLVSVKSSTTAARQEIALGQQTNAEAKAKAVDAKARMETVRKGLKSIIVTPAVTAMQLIDAINAAIPEVVATEADIDDIVVSTTATDNHLQRTAKPLDTADRTAKRLENQVKSEKEFHGLIVAAIVGFAGIAILAYCMHSIRIAVAGAIGCGIVIFCAIAVGEVWSHFWQIVLTGGAICLIAIAYEIYDHGGLSPALFKKAHDEANAVRAKLASVIPAGMTTAK